MQLTLEEMEMLTGALGRATQKAMQILVALGDIYGAVRMIPVSSVQIAGVSYDNLGRLVFCSFRRWQRGAAERAC